MSRKQLDQVVVQPVNMRFIHKMTINQLKHLDFCPGVAHSVLWMAEKSLSVPLI